MRPLPHLAGLSPPIRWIRAEAFWTPRAAEASPPCVSRMAAKPGMPRRCCAEAAPPDAVRPNPLRTAIPGLIFSGSNDGHLRGYSAEDGKILWDF